MDLQTENPACHSIPVDLLQKLLLESDIHKVLGLLTNYVPSAFSDTRGIIMIYDATRNRLVQGSNPDLQVRDGDPDNSVPVGPDLTTSAQAAFFKTPVFANDVRTHSSWKNHLDFAEKYQVGAAYAMPILSGKGELLGTFALYFKEALKELPVEIRLFETLTGLAAITLERYQTQIKNKAILAELQASQERLNLALKSQKMGVWDWYVPQNKLIWDDAMFALFGMDKSMATGTLDDWAQLTHPEDVETTYQVLNNVFEKHLPFDHQFRVIRHGEIRHLAAVGFVVRDEYGIVQRMTGLNWDITDKVETSKKIEQSKAKSIASSKMASLGEMASGIAHEINNPLTIILNRASQLKGRLEKGVLDPRWAIEELDKIEITVERIAKIIRGLRTFSRNSEDDPLISCDLNSVIEETLELCREKFIIHGVDLRLSGLSHLGEMSIRCRPAQISQVLLYLLNNSFDAVCRSQKPWIEIEVTVLHENILIRVTDSGLGIPSKIADKVMDPFFTTKEVGKGTGLGLSISKGIVEDHDGKIWLDTENTHTSFVLQLPLEQVSHPIKSSSISLEFQQH